MATAAGNKKLKLDVGKIEQLAALDDDDKPELPTSIDVKEPPDPSIQSPMQAPGSPLDDRIKQARALMATVPQGAGAQPADGGDIGSAVANYIKNKLAATHAPDADIGRAQQQASVNRALAAGAPGVGQLGRNLVNMTAQRAGMGQQMKEPTPASEAEIEAPVQKYIQKKALEQSAGDKDIGDAGKAAKVEELLHKASSGSADDIKTLLRLVSASQHETSLGQKDRSLGQRDTSLGQGGERIDQKAFDSNRKLGGSIIPGVHWTNPEAVPQKTADAVSAVMAATDKLKSGIADLQSMRSPTFGYAKLPGSTAAAKIHTIGVLLQPLFSASSGMGNFTKGHQHLAEQMVSDPQSLVGLLNSGALDAQMKEILDHAEQAKHAMVTRASGGGGRLDIPGEAPQVAPHYNPHSRALEQARPQSTGLDDEDREAIKYAIGHPNDPSSSLILQHHGLQ